MFVVKSNYQGENRHPQVNFYSTKRDAMEYAERLKKHPLFSSVVLCYVSPEVYTEFQKTGIWKNLELIERVK